MTSSENLNAIVTEIVIHASARRIFDALVDPVQRVQWWGAPERFQTTRMESDLKPGGAWKMQGFAAGNKPFTLRGEYTRIEPPSLLEFTWLPDWGEPQSLVRFELTELAGSTTVRVVHGGFSTAASQERYQGWQLLLAMLRKFIDHKLQETN